MRQRIALGGVGAAAALGFLLVLGDESSQDRFGDGKDGGEDTSSEIIQGNSDRTGIEYGGGWKSVSQRFNFN